jgi:hypothetical protein
LKNLEHLPALLREHLKPALAGRQTGYNVVDLETEVLKFKTLEAQERHTACRLLLAPAGGACARARRVGGVGLEALLFQPCPPGLGFLGRLKLRGQPA